MDRVGAYMFRYWYAPSQRCFRRDLCAITKWIFMPIHSNNCDKCHDHLFFQCRLYSRTNNLRVSDGGCIIISWTTHYKVILVLYRYITSHNFKTEKITTIINMLKFTLAVRVFMLTVVYRWGDEGFMRLNAMNHICMYT